MDRKRKVASFLVEVGFLTALALCFAVLSLGFAPPGREAKIGPATVEYCESNGRSHPVLVGTVRNVVPWGLLTGGPYVSHVGKRMVVQLCECPIGSVRYLPTLVAQPVLPVCQSGRYALRNLSEQVPPEYSADEE